MKLASYIVSAVVGIVLLSTHAKVWAVTPQVDRFALANGIRVVSLYMPDSNHVSLFAFLPMGLAWEGPGQAQWSHLVEHLTIRSTIAGHSAQANAETLPDHMRLDFYGTTENWQQGLEHLARWLGDVTFRDETLEAEKPKVMAEGDFVAKNFATHKFAVSAWAQGYRHGRKHAGLKADVTEAALKDIQQYRDQHLVVLEKIVVCVVGGVDARSIEPVIGKRLGTIQSNAKTAPVVKLYPENRKMTWDLNARHLLLTWPIPAVADEHYPALMVAGHWLMMKFFSDAELKKHTGMVLAGADLTTPEGNFFYVSASLKPDASFDDVTRQIERHLQSLSSDRAVLAEAIMIGQQLSYQLTTPPDPAMYKAQAPNVSEAMIEGNIGLQWAMQDFRYGEHRAGLAKELAAVTAEKIHQAAAKYLAKERRSVCSIEPKAK